MRILRSLGLAVLAVLPARALAAAPAVPAGRPAAPVALVFSLTGTAALAAVPASRPLRRLDRLPAGAAVEVGPASRLALIFASGARYELGERARATLGNAGLASHTGAVRELPRTPPFRIPVAIADDEDPGLEPGAPRGEEIDCLSPQGGAATLADATILRFRPADGASRHEVAVEDSLGDVIFQTVTESSAVAVPPGTLAAGARYHWTVKTLNRPGPVARGKADFVTLSRKVAADRERLKKAVEAEDDGRELLDAVDRALGMAGEGCPWK